MRFGSRVQSSDCVRRHFDRCLKAESHVGGSQIIVDRLGNADHGQSLLVQSVGYTREPSPAIAMSASISSSANRSTISPGSICGPPGSVRLANFESKRIPLGRGAQNRAAQVCDPANRLGREREDARLSVHLTLQQARIAAPNSEHFPASLQSRQSRRADHRVQARGVAPAGVDGNSANLLSSCMSVHQRAVIRVSDPRGPFACCVRATNVPPAACKARQPRC